MNHSFKKFLALVLTAATVFSLSAVAASSVFGADAATGTGKTPIAAFDFTKDLKDHSGRTDVPDVVLDPESDGRTDTERLAATSHSGRATWAEGTGITVANGFFKLPENIFSGTDVSKIDGFTLSFTLTKTQNPWNTETEMLFSFAEKDYFADRENTNSLPLGERSDASVHMIYHGCIGSGEHPYMAADGSGSWIDGALDAWGHESPILTYGTPHNVTVTYDTASNTLVLYVDGMLVATSKDSTWEVLAKLTNEDIHKLTSLIMGRPNDGFSGFWGFGTYSDVTIYSTALNAREVSTLANDGWEAVRDYANPTSALLGEGDGTFTAAALNVDGLPVTLGVSMMGSVLRTVTMNEGGPGADGTTEMSALIAEKGWDILGVSENFNYATQLAEALIRDEIYTEINGNTATVPEVVELFDPLSPDSITNLCDENNVFIPLDTDGLSLFFKTGALTVAQADKVAWTTKYSTNNSDLAGLGYQVPTENGGDGLIQKGFRHFTATINGKLTVDVYTLHMDADSTTEDIAARKAQIKQLVDYIAETKTENPIIIMGDTNCRYLREDLQTNLIGEINRIEGLDVKDAWVESGSDAGEVVDKIFFINNDKSDYQLFVKDYKLDTITGAEGSSLSDHKAAVATFAYAKKYDVTYTDGVDGAAFKPQTHHTYSTNPTPAFNGTPTRDGYTFKGWTPAVAATVTGNATYVATWEAVPSSNPGGGQGQVTPPTTGDTANVAALLTVLAISGIGVTATVRAKKKDR